MVHPERTMTIALHKPAGFVSTRSDPTRATRSSICCRRSFRAFSTSAGSTRKVKGLLLLTNDGDLTQRLTHPRFKIEKEYEVTLDRQWQGEHAPKLLRGIFLDGQRAQIARVKPIGSTRLRLVLRQGINQQIRRMLYAVGYEVKRLVRVRIGNLRLAGLPLGHWRPVTKTELAV